MQRGSRATRARDQPAEQLFFLCSACRVVRRPRSGGRRAAAALVARLMHIGGLPPRPRHATAAAAAACAVAPAATTLAATLLALAPGDTPRRRPLFAKGVLSISLVRRDIEIGDAWPWSCCCVGVAAL